MKSLLILLLLTVTTQSTASAPVGAHTATRLVVLTFEGSKEKAVFFINAGQTKEAINALIKKKTRETIQKCPKQIQFSSQETTFPEVITDEHLEKNYPANASIKIHVIEYDRN